MAKKTIVVRDMDSELWTRLKTAAAAQEVPLKDLLVLVVSQYLDARATD